MATVVRCASTADKREMTALWRAAFPEDSSDDVDDFLSYFLTPDCAFVLQENTRVVSMVFLLDAQMVLPTCTEAVGYIYAGATAPDARGKGYYRRLLEYVEDIALQRGLSALFLRPADEALAASYRRMGFTLPMTVGKPRAGHIPGLSPADSEAFVKASQYIWQAKALPYIAWSEAVLRYRAMFTQVMIADENAVLCTSDGGVLLECVGADTVLCENGLLKPLKERIFEDISTVYMGYGLE